MLKRSVLLLLAAALCLGGAACDKKQTQAELKAQRVREFRAKQKQMALKAYQAIVEKYPDSEFAPKAQARLDQLGPPAATPKPPKKK